MTALLRVEGVSKSFGGRGLSGSRRVQVVKNVSFSLEPGETLALVGESGAGKSTIGQMVMRLLAPDSGRIFLGSQELTSLRGRALRATRHRLQMIFQDPFSCLNPRMPVIDAVAEPLHLLTPASRAEARRKGGELLEEVGIGSQHFYKQADEFSGGQLQRIATARAMICGPELVVCDEPVSALDVSIQAQVLNVLLNFQEQRKLSYLFISHDLDLVRSFADRVAVLSDGEIVEEGPTERLFSSPQHPYTRTLLGAAQDVAGAVRARWGDSV